MNRLIQNTEQAEAPLSTSEAAEFLGACISTINRWRKHPRNPLPAHIVGRRVFFLKPEILSWLASHRDHPMVSSPRIVKQRVRKEV